MGVRAIQDKYPPHLCIGPLDGKRHNRSALRLILLDPTRSDSGPTSISPDVLISGACHHVRKILGDDHFARACPRTTSYSFGLRIVIRSPKPSRGTLLCVPGPRCRGEEANPRPASSQQGPVPGLSVDENGHAVFAPAPPSIAKELATKVFKQPLQHDLKTRVVLPFDPARCPSAQKRTRTDYPPSPLPYLLEKWR